MPNSSGPSAPAKPRRSRRADFPLFVHKGAQRWCKKVKSKHVYFHRVEDDPSGSQSLQLWLDQRDDLLAGRKPKTKRDDVTLEQLVNHFLHYKQSLVDSDELSANQFDKYKRLCRQLVDILGRNRSAADVGPDDFSEVRSRLAKRYGPQSLSNHVQTVRSVFKHGYDVALLERPARFGKLRKPRAKVMRETRISKGPQDFTAAEVRALLDASTVNMKAMVLLAVQAGFGNTDCGDFPIDAIDFRTGWVTWHRQKTATTRRFHLWPETLEAIQAAIDQRPVDSPLVFIGPQGSDYIGARKGYRVATEFKTVAKRAGVNKSFYCGRRTFQTQGDESGDSVATSAIMAHVPRETDMAARYRQRISDRRLKAVTDHVHRWLWPRPNFDVVEVVQ